MKALKKLWAWISKVWESLNAKTKEMVPIAIKVVEAVKNFELSSSADFIEWVVASAIPGDADDKVIKKSREVVRKWLPKILIELQLIESIADMETIDEKLKAIVAQLRLSSDETQNIVNHGLATLIIEKLSDGELSWSDSIAISEYYFKNIYKK